MDEENQTSSHGHENMPLNVEQDGFLSAIRNRFGSEINSGVDGALQPLVQGLLAGTTDILRDTAEEMYQHTNPDFELASAYQSSLNQTRITEFPSSTRRQNIVNSFGRDMDIVGAVPQVHAALSDISTRQPLQSTASQNTSHQSQQVGASFDSAYGSRSATFPRSNFSQMPEPWNLPSSPLSYPTFVDQYQVDRAINAAVSARTQEFGPTLAAVQRLLEQVQQSLPNPQTPAGFQTAPPQTFRAQNRPTHGSQVNNDSPALHQVSREPQSSGAEQYQGQQGTSMSSVFDFENLSPENEEDGPMN
jgi:hypothetical protein